MTEQEVSQQPIALYRLFAANDVLLYVGVTDNPRARFAQHAKDKRWWPLVARTTVTWQDTREQALRAELEAIETENPLHNIQRDRAVVAISGKPHSESRRRGKLVALRLLPAERATLDAAAQDRGVTLSEFIRASALHAASADDSQVAVRQG